MISTPAKTQAYKHRQSLTYLDFYSFLKRSQRLNVFVSSGRVQSCLPRYGMEFEPSLLIRGITILKAYKIKRILKI